MTDLANITAALVALGIPRREPLYAHGRWQTIPRGLAWYIEDHSDLSSARDDGYTQAVVILEQAQDYTTIAYYCCDASGRLVQLELHRNDPAADDQGLDIEIQYLPTDTTPAQVVARIAALNTAARHYIATHHA